MGKVWGFRGELPDTPTFGCRRWVLVPFDHAPGHPLMLGDFLLTVTQRPHRTNAVELDTYGGEEVSPELLGCRTFLLVNLTDPEQEQPYRCTVGPTPRCSCDAGRKGYKRTSCKHKDALTAVLAAGLIPARQIQGA